MKQTIKVLLAMLFAFSAIVLNAQPDTGKAAIKKPRIKNKLKPVQGATGPHSSYATDKSGNIFKYEEWEVDNNNRKEQFKSVKRFDGGKADGQSGSPHNGVPTPHIQKGKQTTIPTILEFPKNPRFPQIRLRTKG